MRLATAVERNRARRHQLNSLAIVQERGLILIERGKGVASVVVGGAIIGGERDGAVEILHRLVGVAEVHEGVAAVVVDRGVLGRDLDRLVEIVDRFLGLLQPPFGDAAIAVDARFDEVGDLGIGQSFVVGGHRLVVLTAQERSGSLAGAKQRHVLGAGGHRPGDKDERKTAKG